MENKNREKQVNFMVSEKERIKLNDLAHEHRMNVSEFIRFKILGKK